MPRVDSKALYKALDQQRNHRDLTWSHVAREIGVSISTIAHLQSGGRLEVDGMLAMVGWLGMPVEKFVRTTDV
jgi:transcriptional regulator with XRE-family HTH domain